MRVIIRIQYMMPWVFGFMLFQQLLLATNGVPYMHFYDQKVYEGYNGTWGSIQGDDGVVFIGYGNGILEFDGVTWRKMHLPNQGHVRTFCKDANGRIYLGGLSEMGYLQPDSMGAMRYHSLVSKLDSSFQNFIEIWRTYALGDSIIFVSERSVIVYSHDEMKVWESANRIRSSHVLNKELILDIKDEGVFTLGTLGFIPEEISWPGQSAMMELVNWNHQVVYARNTDGLFIREQGGFIPLEYDAKNYIQEHKVYRLHTLSNGWLCIGTRTGGVVIINENGETEFLIDKDDGLGDNFVSSIMEDTQGSLWITNLEGVTRLEISDGIRIYDERVLPFQNIEALVKHEGNLVVGGSGGVIIFEESGLKQISGVQLVFDLCSVDKQLFIASSNGVYVYQSGTLQKIIELQAHSLEYDPIYPDRVLVGLYNGLGFLIRENERWKFGGLIEGIQDDIREMIVSGNGDLWLEPQAGGVYQVMNPFNSREAVSIHFYKNSKELPSGYSFLKSLNGQPVVNINNNELWKYSYRDKEWVLYDDFAEFFDESVDALFYKEQNDHLLIYLRDSNYLQRAIAYKAESEKYTIQRLHDFRIKDLVNREFLLDEDRVWYAGPDGLIQQTIEKPVSVTKGFEAWVRSVAIGRDSIIYYGQPGFYQAPILSFKHNELRFNYAASSYTLPEENLYQVRLDGFDKAWSDWTLETQRDYTNLPAGTYTFQIRAKNVHGVISHPGEFDFEILAPWYQTVWAYLIYLIGGIFLVYILIKWRSQQLVKEKERLENLVDEKVHEIKKQAEQLQELDKMKSRFFENISHEFRTPLTLINTPLEDHIRKETTPDREELEMMQQSARKLRRLIDQILDLSKIQTEGLTLNTVQGDIAGFVKTIASSFSSMAHYKDIRYTLDMDQAQYLGRYDPDKVEKIIANLLSNAFKFTPKGGHVLFQINFENEHLNMVVSDSGQGIDPSEMDLIFNRFYRTRQTEQKEQEGTGIGLALTAQLVKLMEGTIQVHSELNKGSTFTVSIPISISTVHSPVPNVSQESLEKQPLKWNGDSVPAADELPLILVVEDNEDLGKYIKKIIGSQYAVKHVFDGTQGLYYALENIPDLIISDVMMPEMDGMEMSSLLKQDTKTSHIPIIMLTAKVEPEHKLEGLKIGVDDYLGKPFNAEELLTRIDNLIQQRRRLQDKYSDSLILKPTDLEVDSMEAQFIKSAMEIVESNLNNPDFTVEDFTRSMGLSRMQLHRKLKALTGQSATQFIREMRLQRAKSLLEENAGTVSEICFQVGYNNLSYFTKTFKERFGELPSVMRKA